MNSNAVNRVFIGAILLLVVFVFLLLRKNKKVVRQEIALKDLSALWAKGRASGELHISELAPIWRDEKNLAEFDGIKHLFLNKRVVEFYSKQIEQAPWFRKAGLQKEVCAQILQLLDTEGGCSSVVNAADDVEASWDSNTYTLLGKTSLLDHTLNVAEESIKILLEADARHVIPDTLIAALGHDLGKLPSIIGHLYSLGEHPLAAGRVLAEILPFKQLAKKEEISRSIKLHHKRPEGLLGKTLKKADQLARQQELEQAVEQLGNREAKQPQPTFSLERTDKDEFSVQPEPVTPPHAPAAKGSPPGQGSAAAWQAQVDIFGEEEPLSKKKSEVPHLIDIASWFDAQVFLDAMKPYINKVSGRRFMAFSMADGYVYFQAKVIEEVARKQAKQAGAMDIATMAADDPTMRQVLFTVVHRLRMDHDVIARGLIKDQYFGGYFTITTTGGKTMKGFYTPFHAEAFGSIAEMENNKSGILNNFKKVEPYLDD